MKLNGYKVEWYKTNIATSSPELQGPYNLFLKEQNLSEARKKANSELSKIGIRGITSDVVAVRIRREPEGKWHILYDFTNEKILRSSK